MANITQDIEIKAPAADLFEAITSEAGIRGWWTQTATVDEQSAQYRFEHGKMWVRFRYDTKDATRIELTCVENQNNPEWQDTTLLFELEENGDNTHLHFVHDQWKKEGTEIYNVCVGGWDYFLNSLKAYAETGEGTPHDKAE